MNENENGTENTPGVDLSNEHVGTEYQVREEFNFSDALVFLKTGRAMTRSGWWDAGIKVYVQYPDENSKMTQPYLYMEKGDQKFPLDLSCESIFANDWIVAELNQKLTDSVNLI